LSLISLKRSPPRSKRGNPTAAALLSEWLLEEVMQEVAAEKVSPRLPF